jgi:hypothetical protein
VQPQPQARAKSAVHCDTEHLGVDEHDGGEMSPAAPRQLDWKLVYSGQERQVDVKDMTPATQYQFKVFFIQLCEQLIKMKEAFYF